MNQNSFDKAFFRRGKILEKWEKEEYTVRKELREVQSPIDFCIRMRLPGKEETKRKEGMNDE